MSEKSYCPSTGRTFPHSVSQGNCACPNAFLTADSAGLASGRYNLPKGPSSRSGILPRQTLWDYNCPVQTSPEYQKNISLSKGYINGIDCHSRPEAQDHEIWVTKNRKAGPNDPAPARYSFVLAFQLFYIKIRHECSHGFRRSFQCDAVVPLVLFAPNDVSTRCVHHLDMVVACHRQSDHHLKWQFII